MRLYRDADFDSDWVVDTGDLVILAENWLWIACWKQSQIDRFDAAVMEMMMMGGGGESMMMAPMEPATMPLEPEPVTMPLEPEPEVSVEPQPEVSPDTLVEIIDFLDEVLAGQPDNIDALYDMKIILEDMLYDLENEVSTE